MKGSAESGVIPAWAARTFAAGAVIAAALACPFKAALSWSAGDGGLGSHHIQAVLQAVHISTHIAQTATG